MEYELDTDGIYYTQLNEAIRHKPGRYVLKNVNGQRYIGAGLGKSYDFQIYGTPGNDMASFMDGAAITVWGDGQDAIGNTMNAGRVVIHGNASDTVGYAMRNGEIFIRGNAGYRVGIHMKQYGDAIPKIVIGGRTGSFLGEYMAGGVILVLGLGVENDEELTGSYCATGMHGGTIYIRGDVPEFNLSPAMLKESLNEEDECVVRGLLQRYTEYFDIPTTHFPMSDFIKIRPKTSRPYGKMYVGN